MIISKVISTAIVKSVNYVKILRFGSRDVQTGYNIQPFGIDSNIPAGYRGIFADTGNAGEKILLGIINSKAVANVGELRLHSEKTDNSESIYIYLKNNGTAEIGGSADNLVRYSKLETGFNKLKEDLNNLITVFNSHVHPGVLSGSASTSATITTGSSSTASISDAKINELKTL